VIFARLAFARWPLPFKRGLRPASRLVRARRHRRGRRRGFVAAGIGRSAPWCALPGRTPGGSTHRGQQVGGALPL